MLEFVRNRRSRAYTTDLMLKSFQRIWPEYDITTHGLRATYQTIVHEHLGIDPIVFELSLSHRMPSALGAVRVPAQNY